MKKNFALIIMAVLFLPSLVMPGSAQQSGKSTLRQKRKVLRPKAEDDADVPRFARDKIDKRDYLLRRQAQIDKYRGTKDDPFGFRRARAIREMERQERLLRPEGSSPNVVNTPLVDSSTVWTPLGPAPIPNGQTEGAVTPVSGRTTAIAIHPTNPNIVYIGTAQGGLYRTLDGGVTFTALTDKAMSLAIGAVAIAPSSPSTVFVGTGETALSGDSYAGVGLYRIDNADGDSPVLNGPFSNNGAATNVLAGRSISRIAVHPTDANIIFLGTSTGIAGIGGDVPTGAPTRGVFRSTNALTTCTFTKLNLLAASDRRVQDVRLDPATPDNLLVSVADTSGSTSGVYRSTNAQAATPTFTQTLSISAFTSVLRGEFAINRVASVTTVYYASGEIDPNDTLPTCESQGDEGTLRKSTDGGVTWSLPILSANGFCGPQCFYDISLAVDPANANNVLLGGNVTGFCSRLIARSTDGGTSFTDVPNGVHPDNHVSEFAPSNPSIAYMGTDGGFYKSTNGGAAWASVSRAGLQATQFQSIALHPLDRHFMIGGTQDNGTEFLQPNFNWKRADFGDGGFALIDQSATNNENVTMYHTYFNATGVLLGYSRMNLTSCANEGQWSFKGIYAGPVDPTIHCDGTTDSFNGISIADAVEFYAPIALGPGTPNTVYFGSDKLYRSINKGDTAVVSSQAFPATVSAIGISRQDDNRRIVGLSNGQVFATTTGVPPMTDVTGPIPARYVARAVVDPNSVDTAYVTLAGFGLAAGQHVWKTTNLNSATPTWTASGTGIPDVPVNAFVVDPANSMNLYAGTDIGVYRSTNGGGSWTPFGIGFPRVAVFDMAIQNPHRVLRVTTHGRGMWEIKLNPVAAKVADFNGDGRTDLAVQRPSDGTWYSLQSTLSVTDPQTVGIVNFPGTVGDTLTPGDYDGDGKTDFAVFRSSDNTWRIHFSGGGADSIVSFGTTGDKPVQADYDGDGKTDIAVFRPAGANWFVLKSSDNALAVFQWGLSSDKLVQGDYDGDNKADLAVFRPSTSIWYVAKSTCNYACFDGAQWGLNTDKLVPADYDGDGKFDRAVFRGSTGTWYVLKSGDGAVRSVSWGASSDTPVPGDYDGDGMTDFAVWRGSAGDWFVLKSSNQPVRGQHWGLSGDVPVPAAYIFEQ